MDKDELKVKELTKEQLEKVIGGLISVSELCASCQEYEPKDPNGIKGTKNCQKYNGSVAMCKVMVNAGYQISY